MSEDKIIIMIYFLSLALYGILEMRMHRKYSNLKSARQEKSFMLFVIPFYLCVYLSPLEYVWLKPKLSLILIIAGFLLFYGAIITRIISFKTLGNNFSVAIESKIDSNLVVHGIYKYTRHPLYLSIFIISVSGSLIFSCLYMWIFVVLTFIGILIRIKKEESFLILHYSEYQQYKKGTKKLIPWIY
jgi:protein-S-isoprenylcysteine O-methyltransferase Ste14